MEQQFCLLLFLLLKYRLVMRHRPSLEDNEPRAYLNCYKQSELAQNKRFSPDYSSVLENQNMNLLDPNELSWLQKFAEDNEKICSSGLFDQHFSNSRGQQVTNQMKFSFNMNYSLEDKRKEDQGFSYKSKQNQTLHGVHQSKSRFRADESKNVLTDIKNTENVAKAPSRKDSLPGSIKKNQKINKQIFEEVSEYQRQVAQNTPMSKLQEMSEKLNKALQKDRSSSLLSINNKQNIRKDSVKKSNFKDQEIFVSSNTDKFEDSLKYYQRNKQIPLQVKRQAKPKQNQIIKREQSIRIVPTYKNGFAYQFLFDKLDKNQLGKLTKTNCFTESISEEFKFIFGTLLTKIKYKQLSCTKSQFVKLCENIIKELDSVQIVDLLSNLCPSQKESFPRNNRETYPRTNNEWQPVDDTKRINQRNPFQTFEAKQFKKSVSLLESTFKADSKIESRMNSSIFNDDKASKITSQSIRKYNDYQRPSLKKSVIFDDATIFKNDFELSNKIQINDMFSNKKYSNISEKTIEQHKKGLDNLNRLNKRMQSCLNTNILSEHNKQGLMREDNLKFSELIKHV